MGIFKKIKSFSGKVLRFIGIKPEFIKILVKLFLTLFIFNKKERRVRRQSLLYQSPLLKRIFIDPNESGYKYDQLSARGKFNFERLNELLKQSR